MPRYFHLKQLKQVRRTEAKGRLLLAWVLRSHVLFGHDGFVGRGLYARLMKTPAIALITVLFLLIRVKTSVIFRLLVNNVVYTCELAREARHVTKFTLLSVRVTVTLWVDKKQIESL